MASQMVRILDGNTFVVCDERGDIEASPTEPTGLFSFDMRYLSQWVMTVNGGRLNSLSVDDLHYFESRFFLVPGTGTVYIDAKLSVIRQRAVGHGFHEELTILNHEATPVDLVIRIDAASDFADLFEVKDALKKVGTYSSTVEGGTLRLALPARVVPEGDAHHLVGAGRVRRARASRSRSRSRGTAAGRPTSTSPPPGRRAAAPTPGRSTSAGASRRARTWSAASTSGWPTRRGSTATGSR